MASSPKRQDTDRKVEIWKGNEDMSKVSNFRGQIVNI